MHSIYVCQRREEGKIKTKPWSCSGSRVGYAALCLNHLHTKQRLSVPGCLWRAIWDSSKHLKIASHTSHRQIRGRNLSLIMLFIAQLYTAACCDCISKPRGRERGKARERERKKNLFKCTLALLLSLGAHLQEETDAEVKRKGELLGCDHKSTSHTISPASPGVHTPSNKPLILDS